MDRITKMNKKIFENFNKSALNIMTNFESPTRENMLSELRDYVVQTCDLDEHFRRLSQISERIPQLSQMDEQNDELNMDLDEEPENLISNIVTDPSKNVNLKEFDRIVKLLTEDLNPKNQETGDEGELQVTQTSMNTIDPISKKPIEFPVINLVCSHVYDRDSVQAMLKGNPHSRCPVPGCKDKNDLSLHNLIPDMVTLYHLKKVKNAKK